MWLLWTVCAPVLVASTCLPDGVISTERQNLTTVRGESYPVGLWVPTWAAGRMTSTLLQILIEERLGLNVRIGEGSSTTSQMWAITGCSTPTLDDPGCGVNGPQETRFHVSVEGWTLGYALTWEKIQSDYPSTAPINLGNMGYDGAAGQYVSANLVDETYDTTGIALDFYRSYDSRFRNVSEYFDPIIAFNTSDFQTCEESRFSNVAMMQTYLEVTGDLDGVETVNGKLRAKCFSGHFWLPPSCRQDVSRCLVFITVDPGYDLATMMQRATIWKMPVVPAVVKEWDTFEMLPTKMRCLYYWWEPDTTFLSLKGKDISYSPHDAAAVARGDTRSSAKGLSIDKYVSYDLEELAPFVLELVKAFQISMPVLYDMLEAQQVSGSTATDEACKWLQANPTVWENWLPDATKCFPQYGLYNRASGIFANERSWESRDLVCKTCASGTFSDVLRDGQGLTHICRACAPGFAQAAAASTACDPCDVGHFQEDFGAYSCQRCSTGFYQDTLGQNRCKACPADRTTLGLGSESFAECVCTAGFIEQNRTCTPCVEGLSCPTGSTVDMLRTAESMVQTKLLEGYNSLPEDPLTIYRCRPGHCPGGLPGNCSSGREGFACGACPEKTFASVEGECSDCAEANPLLWLIVGGLLLCAGIFPAYYLGSRPYRAKMNARGIMGAILGVMANVIQNLIVVSTAPTTWPNLMLSASSTFRVLTMNLEVVGIGCLGLSGPQSFILQALIFPGVMSVILLIFALTRIWPSSFRPFPSLARFFAWTWYGTASLIGKFCTVTFPTMVNVGMSPLMCFEHPGGQTSLVKYSNIFCGSGDQAVMLIAGTGLLTVATAFLTLCIWAGFNAPRLSWEWQAALKFLFEDFRPDVGWFGTVTLSRGLLLSLPSVVASNSPNVQLVLLHSVMLLSLVFQAYLQPWKTPMLNLLDSLTQALFLTLLGVGLGGLSQDQGEGDANVLEILGALLCILLGVVIVLALATFILALLMETFWNNKAADICGNLGEVPDSQSLAHLLRNVASSIKRKDSKEEAEAVIEAMDELSAYDARMLLNSLCILETEVGLTATSRKSVAILNERELHKGYKAFQATRLRVIAQKSTPAVSDAVQHGHAEVTVEGDTIRNEDGSVTGYPPQNPGDSANGESDEAGPQWNSMEGGEFPNGAAMVSVLLD